MKRLVALLLFCWAAPAAAARVMPANLRGLVDGATLVVLGEALSAEAYWQDGRILTRTRIQVEDEWLRAQTTPATIEVVTLGGVVDGIGQHVTGEAVIPTTGRMVLFLTPTSWGLRVVGLSQGLFYVDDAALKTKPLARRLAGLEWAGSPPPSLPTDLDSLKRQVQELRHAK